MDEQALDVEQPSLTPTPQPVPAPVSPALEEPQSPAPLENGSYSSKDFEIDAFSVLDQENDFNSGVNRLIDIYKSKKFDDPQDAKRVLSEYSDNLYYKTKQSQMDPVSVMAAAPVPPTAAVGKNDIEKIDSWEEQNITALDASNDPDQIAASRFLKRQIQTVASQARRDKLGGTSSWVTDKFFRVAEGAAGPFMKLAGLDRTDEALAERTNPAMDQDLTSTIASGVGLTVPVLAATGATIASGGAGTPAILASLSTIAAQAGGEARGAYNASMAATGDEARAKTSAALTAVSMLPAMIPTGTAATGAAEAVARRLITGTAEKAGAGALKEIAKTTLSGAAGGAASTVIGNVATNIGLDQNNELTSGVARNALAFGILSGGFGAIRTGLEHTAMRQINADLDKAKVEEELKKPTEEIKEGKKPEDFPLNAYFTKDKDGAWIPKDPEESTVESRAKEAEEFEKAKQELYNQEPPDTYGKLVDEFGGETTYMPATDTEEPINEATMARTIMTGNSKVQPGRFAKWFAGKLGASFQTAKNIQDGAFGSQQGPRIRILRSLGADAEKLKDVLAHEIMHYTKFYTESLPEFESALLDGTTKSFANTWKLFSELSDRKELYDKARAVSADWRGAWDETNADAEKYRGKPDEVWADTGGAFINAPDWLRQNHPEIYKAIEKSFAEVPELNAFFQKILEFNADPDAETRADFQIQHEILQKHGNLQAASKAGKIKQHGLGAVLKRHLDLGHELIFNNLLAAKRTVKTIADKASKAGAIENLDYLSRKNFAPYALFKIDHGVKKAWFRGVQFFKEAKADPVLWPVYEKANRIKNEQTGTMARLTNDYDTYLQAGKVIKSILAEDPHVKKDILNTYLNFDEIKSPEDLMKALAQVNLIEDSADVLDLDDFRGPGISESQAKFAHMRAIANLNRRKTSIPHERLLSNVAKVLKRPDVSEQVKKAVVDITSKNAFSARRFLLNENGTTILDANRDLDYIRKTLGPEKYAKLQDISKEFHNAVNIGYDVVLQSGILSPEMAQRFSLNRDNYVTNSVLKYFHGDDGLDGGIRASIGALSETGNPLVSTPNKMKAVLARAYYQRGVNSAIGIAETGGLNVEPIDHGRPNFDIFAKRDKLAKRDKENSYLVGYNDGKATLYKIPGKGWEAMFKRVSDFPGVGALLYISDQVNKVLLTRHFKTIFSPAFVLAQKFYDRKLEAILANSFELAPGMHLGSKLHKIDASTVAELRHWRTTGELTGGLKKAIDLETATLELATLNHQGVDTQGDSVYDAMHETFGAKQPEDKTVMEKAGNWTEKQLDKFFLSRFFKNMAEFDEIRTKVNGFKIGKEMWGMSDAEAAIFGRENFGVPDPMGGGYAAPLINRMFLFGRAHINGLRVLGNLIKDQPKVAASQIAYRVLLPKMLVMTPIMAPALQQAVGQEAADTFTLLNKMIPDIEKIANNLVILGAQDGKGNFHNFFEINPKDIQQDWKAWYIRVPQSLELTSATRVLWPLVKHLFEGKPGEAIAGAAGGAAAVATANLQPNIQYMVNLMQMVMGQSPTDFFRQKPIFDPTLQMGGSILQKAAKYGQYLAFSQFPAVAPYNPWTINRPVGAGETVIQRYPIAGPLMRRFTGVSNYGLLEASKEGQLAKQQIDSEIRLSTGDSTQQVLNLYSQAAGVISTIGKGWDRKSVEDGGVGPNAARQVHALTSWHSEVWQTYRDRLRAAREKGDTEAYDHFREQLESSATRLLSRLQDLKSAVASSGE